MKRSEIIRRLGPQLERISRYCTDGWKERTAIPSAWAEDIAEALGVTVEPDEPALPDVLEMAQGGDVQGGYQETTVDGICIRVHGATDNRALLHKLITVYNVRPRLRVHDQRSAGPFITRTKP